MFYSANFGRLLGYSPSDYEKTGQNFFVEKIHPEDSVKLRSLGVSILKLFNSFSEEDKLNHKMISQLIEEAF